MAAMDAPTLGVGPSEEEEVRVRGVDSEPIHVSNLFMSWTPAQGAQAYLHQERQRARRRPWAA